MAKLPIRSVIDRALDRGTKLQDFIALPVFFEQQRPDSTEYLETAGPQGIYYPVHGVDVRRVWYTEKSIELDLTNDMHVSIETRPLTFAMHLTNASNKEVDGFIQVQLIRHDEAVSSAALVETRLRNVRQIYAIACIAYGGRNYTQRLSGQVTESSDFESYLPADERLLVNAAGQGTFWATVGVKAAAAVKAAPRAALVALSVFLKGGTARVARAAEAIVKEKEGNADEAVAKGQIAQTAAMEAPTREILATKKQQLELQKQKVDVYFDIRDRIAKIEDPSERATLLAALSQNAKDLLGSVASDLLQLPPSS